MGGVTDATAAFDAHAGGYDAQRRRLVPGFDAFYGAAVDALDLAEGPLRRILDIGAGTGVLSTRVAAAHPEAGLVLLDGAPAMLERAKAALGDRATTCVADFRDPLPDGPFDAVVSALAIHHLDDAGKRDLFLRVHATLAPGAVFVNAEHVAGPTPWLEARYQAWHRAESAALGTTPEEWAAAEERMSFDKLSPVAPHLDWLREAGFTDVDCLFRDHGFAVMVGRRAVVGR